MNIVKEITKDGYILTHEWYYDEVGMKRNSFLLFHIESRTNYPFGKLRINNYDPKSPIEGEDVSPYTDKEYEEMIEEQINAIKEPTHDTNK